MTRAHELALVMAGGILGGAARIGVSETLPLPEGAVPWDLLLINVVGSLALGAAVAYSRARGGLPWFPAVGPGFLGGFTTFSAIAVLDWSTSMGTAAAVGVLTGTMLAAVAAAAAGWWFGDRPATAIDQRAIFTEENE